MKTLLRAGPLTNLKLASIYPFTRSHHPRSIFHPMDQTMAESADSHSINQRGRGSGHRGRGPRNRGRSGGNRGGNDRSNPPTNSVPAFREVVPGVGVSIVLKVDQPTGRQVQGIVADVLTSGNHPHGIKVRLQDGRVGRVQQIVDTGAARTASEGLNNLGRNGESNSLGSGSRAMYHPTFNPGRRQFSDMRADPYDYDTYASSRAAPSLADYIRRPNIKNNAEAESVISPAKQDPSANATDPTTPNAVCPVCGLFEGDEAAVAFHANSHFD
jgi:uncharacterized repeat protein (TIGR03833 family)